MIDTINRWLLLLCKTVSGIAFCFMALVAFVDSISRMTSKPLLGGSEYVEFALIIFFFASLPFVVRDDQHIRVGLFADLYKPALHRMEQIFTLLCEIAALCVLSYMMFDQGSRLLRFGTLSSYLKVPWAPFAFVAAVLSLAAIWFAVLNLVRLRDDPGPHPHAIPDDEA